jgi:hypothetical protein
MGEIHRGRTAPLYKQISTVIGRILAMAAVIMVFLWAKNDNKTNKYLGGLNWDDKVFNYHPPMMILGLLFFFGWGAYLYCILSPIFDNLIILYLCIIIFSDNFISYYVT